MYSNFTFSFTAFLLIVFADALKLSAEMRNVGCTVLLAALSHGLVSSENTEVASGILHAGNKNRPVTKVITLLKDMQKQLEKEAADDEEIYDKMSCWCETNDREKTKAIADAEAKINALTTRIEELTAGSARLNTEIKNTEKEVAKKPRIS
jgi:peptidoglycan hydrolase CwlO-like protein